MGASFPARPVPHPVHTRVVERSRTV
jgi:hypothetical protein